MFFHKKSHPIEESVAKKSVKKMDTVVTGMILWWIVASIYGVKKLKEKAHETEQKNMLPHTDEQAHVGTERKRWILSRIIFGNK